jgi:hypothetical protein
MKKKSMVRGRHDTLARFIFQIYPHVKDNPELKAWLVNGLRNQIFDLGGTYTGYTSKTALESGIKSRSAMTEEHFYPRGQTADYIVNTLMDRSSFTISRCIAFLKSRTRVHMTTAKENMNLRNYAHLHWRDAYAQAGIDLVKHEFVRQNSYVYKVNGTEYNNLRDMAKAHGLAEETVRRRCLNKKPKWSNWSRHEVR